MPLTHWSFPSYSCLKYMTRKYEELSMKNLNAGNTSHLRPIHFLKIEFQHWKSRRVVFQTVQGSEAALVIGTALTLTYSSCHGLGSGRLMGCEIKKKGGGVYRHFLKIISCFKDQAVMIHVCGVEVAGCLHLIVSWNQQITPVGAIRLF